MSRCLGRLFQPVMAPLPGERGLRLRRGPGLHRGLSGGARTAIALYENGQCSRAEAERLLAFCNNSGPAFILGVVGTGVFGSGAAGLLPLSGPCGRLPAGGGAVPLLPLPGAAPPQPPPGGPLSGRPLLHRLHPVGHRLPGLRAEHLRLHPDFSP